MSNIDHSNNHSEQQQQPLPISHERIDTSGTSVSISPDGKLRIVLDGRVTARAFEQVIEYLYTDRVGWDRETDRALIQETKEVSAADTNTHLQFRLQISYAFCKFRTEDHHHHITCEDHHGDGDDDDDHDDGRIATNR